MLCAALAWRRRAAAVEGQAPAQHRAQEGAQGVHQARRRRVRVDAGGAAERVRVGALRPALHVYHVQRQGWDSCTPGPRGRRCRRGRGRHRQPERLREGPATPAVARALRVLEAYARSGSSPRGGVRAYVCKHDTYILSR